MLTVKRITERRIAGRGTGPPPRLQRLSTSEVRITPRVRRNPVPLLLRRPAAQTQGEIAHVQMHYPIESYKCSLKISEIVTAELMEIT
jgi:hypothetical protein